MTLSSSYPNFTFSNGVGTVTFPSNGDEVVINVNCDDDWKATVEGYWLSANVNVANGTLVLTAAENTGEERTDTVTISTTESETVIATINVIQSYSESFYADNASISCSDGSYTTTDEGGTVYFTSYGGEVVIDVSCGIDWTVVTSGEDWLSANVDIESGTLTLTAEENESQTERTATATLSTAESGIVFAKVTVTEGGDLSKVFTLELTIPDESDYEAVLPLCGTVNCTVDWGDGTVDNVVSAFPHHTYAVADTYEVSVAGTVTALSCEDLDDDVKGYITAVKSWGDIGLTSMSHAFYNCSNIKEFPDDIYGAFANVETFNYAFYGTGISTISSGLLQGAANATYFSYCFGWNSSLTTVEDGAFDALSEATDFSGVFYYCEALSSIPVGLFDNSKKVTNFSYTFYYCFALYQESPYTEIDGVKVHLYERTSYPDIYPSTINGNYCFLRTNFSDYDNIPANWKVDG